jgi:hypothetical protein
LRTLGLALVLMASLLACAQARPQPSAEGGPRVRVALMPLEDFGEEVGGAFQVQGLLEGDLAALGYEVVDQASLKRLLLRERVRRTGAVAKGLGRLIGEELGARLLLIGAVTQYRTGPEPCVSVVCRMLDSATGAIVWTGAASARGDQFQTVLGLGKVGDASRLAELVVAKLLEDLPPSGAMVEREVSR